ncbi:MAG: 2-phosphosulfolactate phosphatase [Rikenellaceae bacterium]|nr:2-phosphosulfolactate phosphatase [Rikenellaceae bacterium]
MKIDACISAADVTPERVLHKNCVVIDVFRATSVIITALNAGAERVIPAVTVEEAFRMHKSLAQRGHAALLGGERHAVKVEGFDKGNSPLSYTIPEVRGATIVFTTTNGTRAIDNARAARRIYIGALINAEAVSRRLLADGRDAVLVCSGRENNYTLEDALCAGMIARTMLDADPSIFLTDIARTMTDIYGLYASDLRKGLVNCQHYNHIMSIGLQDDVEYCLRRNICDTVPYVDELFNIIV